MSRRTSAAAMAVTALAGMAAAGLALHHGLALGARAAASPRLPLWDMAKYGASGLRLLAAVADLDPLAFVARVSELSVWPPVYPLLEAVAFAVFGPGYGVPRALVAACFGLAVVLTFWAGTQVGPLGGCLEAGAEAGTSPGVGLLAASWLAGGPFFQGLATVNLLEIPGVLALSLAVGCHLRALRLGHDRAWRAAWLAAAVLLFTKYNYGLLWLVPVGLHGALQRSGSWRGLAVACARWAAGIDWRRPWTVFLALYAVVLAAVLATGGVDTEVLGRRLRVTSPGNPVYLLMWLALLRLVLRGPRAWRRTAAVLERWNRRSRGAVAWLGLPVLAWMLVPPHVKDFFGFLGNRSSHLPPLSALAFYPRVLVEVYAPAVWLGVAVGVAGLGQLSAVARRRPRRRLLALALLVGLVAVVVHPYKLPRFAVTTFWLLGLCGAVAASDLLQAAGRRWGGRGEGLGRGLLLAAGLAAVAATWHAGVDWRAVEREHALRSVPAQVSPLLDRLVDLAVETAERPGGGGLVVLGTWNDLSPGLLEWHARARYGPGSPPAVPVAARDLVRAGDAAGLRRRLEAGGTCVAEVRRRGGGPRYTAEVAWSRPVSAWLATSPAYRRRDVDLPAQLGYELTLYCRSSASSSTVPPASTVPPVSTVPPPSSSTSRPARRS